MYHIKVQFLDGEIRTVKINIQGLVVQSIDSLTSLLMTNSLIVIAKVS